MTLGEKWLDQVKLCQRRMDEDSRQEKKKKRLCVCRARRKLEGRNDIQGREE
ncbi:hypothetical protein E3U43_000432 [Larimichthys crocea]|uniref:Uncharacterized protein n=1 Tax=Larimichthys crocea TaxID=215358 RepID=A0ACD3Q8S9_LARCR|nr:hypothetical protein E3U43_000432 [Larimichthys crocea]